MTGGSGRIAVRDGSWVCSGKIFYGASSRDRWHNTHLNIDAIKFIEAAPRAAPRQAFEKLGHSKVVQTVGTVEYHTLHE